MTNLTPMKKINIKILSLVIIIFLSLFSNVLLSQEIVDKGNEVEIIFSKIGNGIKTGAIREFSDKLMAETYISLESGVSAYFSADQSFYVLKDFFQHFKPTGFKMIKKNSNSETPFAVGQLTYSKNGVRGESQVFITLKLENEEWKISQLIIN